MLINSGKQKGIHTAVLLNDLLDTKLTRAVGETVMLIDFSALMLHVIRTKLKK